MRSTILFILVIAGLGLGLFTYQFTQTTQPSSGIEGLYYPQTKAIQPFSLTDYDEQSFNLDRLQDKWTLLFFGYTHCPDICPMTLNTLKHVKQQLATHPNLDADTQYVFVSVDGQRDTPALLKGYVTYFDSQFMGVTGVPDAVNGLTRQLGIVYFKVPGSSADNYLVDHSSSILLVNPQAELVGVFSTPHAAEDIAARYVEMRDFIAQYES